jgi:hypothetical protein
MFCSDVSYAFFCTATTLNILPISSSFYDKRLRIRQTTSEVSFSHYTKKAKEFSTKDSDCNVEITILYSKKEF